MLSKLSQLLVIVFMSGIVASCFIIFPANALVNPLRVWRTPIYSFGLQAFGSTQLFGNLNLQGNRIDFNQGDSRIYDDAQLHIATDDFLYLDAPQTVFVKTALEVGTGLTVRNGSINLPVNSLSGASIADSSLSAAKFAPGAIAEASGALPLTGGTISGNLNVTGNLTVDTNTLAVDASTNQVGIGTTTPGASLHIHNATNNAAVLRLDSANSASGGHAGRIELNGPSSPAPADTKNFAIVNINTPLGSSYNVLQIRQLNDAISAQRGLLAFAHGGGTTPGALLIGDYAHAVTSVGPSGGLAVSGSVGIGTVSPSTQLHTVGDSGTDMKATVRTTGTLRQHGFALHSTNGSYTNPFTSNTANGFTTGDPVDPDFIGGIFQRISTAGGLEVIGNGTGASTPGVSISSNKGTESTTQPAILLTTVRSDGSGGRQEISATGQVFGIYNLSSNLLTMLGNGNLGITTMTPESALHVPDGKYAQFQDNNAGAPPAGDCDNDAERGRMSIDTSNNRLYICNGASRAWDFVDLTN